MIDIFKLEKKTRLIYPILSFMAIPFIIFGQLILVGCFTHQDVFSDNELLKHYEGISNIGILWDGDIIGLQPYLIGEDEKWLLKTELDPTPLLLKALSDKDRWVAAHVILTLRYSLQKKEFFIKSPTQWNGLRVELLGSGKVKIDGSQQVVIRKFWVEKLKDQAIEIRKQDDSELYECK